MKKILAILTVLFIAGAATSCKKATDYQLTEPLTLYKNLTVPAAIVIGNEGDGMSQLVRKNCDVMVHIPMKGRISSLNASAAASILLYEAVRQRLN